MPMLFWLPAIIVSGWWSVLTGESSHPVGDQPEDGGPPARLST
jgi:hypothetical protein